MKTIKDKWSQNVVNVNLTLTSRNRISGWYSILFCRKNSVMLHKSDISGTENRSARWAIFLELCQKNKQKMDDDTKWYKIVISTVYTNHVRSILVMAFQIINRDVSVFIQFQYLLVRNWCQSPINTSKLHLCKWIHLEQQTFENVIVQTTNSKTRLIMQT